MSKSLYSISLHVDKENDIENDDKEKDNDKTMIILDMHPCWQPQPLMDNGSQPLTKYEETASNDVVTTCCIALQCKYSAQFYSAVKAEQV